MTTAFNKHDLSFRAIFYLSIPSVIAVGLEPLAALVDTIYIGHLNTRWLASLAVVNSILLSFAWIFNFLNTAVIAWVANAYGANDHKQVDVAVTTTMIIVFTIGLAVALILYFGKEFFLMTLLGVDKEVFSETLPYWFWRVITYPFVILNIGLIGILRGLQKIHDTLVVVVFQTLSNVLMTYLLLYVYPLGMQGAGIGTFLSFLIASSLSLYFVFIKYQYRINLSLLKTEFSQVLLFAYDSFNNFGRSAVLTLCFFLLTAGAARLGVYELAAHQVALQMWLLSSFALDGFAVTVTSFGAKMLGAKNINAFKVLSNKTIMFSFGLGLVVSFIFYFGKSIIYLCFSSDNQLHLMLDKIWLVIVVSQSFNAVLYILDGVLFGAREFSFLKKRMFEGFFLFFLPTALLGIFYIKSFLVLWVSLSLLNIYRCVSELYWYRNFYKKTIL